MKDGDVVKRNGNYFKIKKDNHNHYYTALILGNARVSAWHRTTVKSLSENYEHVKDYDGNKVKFDWIKEL